MRTETITKRPFFRIPDELQAAVQACGLRFAGAEDFDSGPSITCSIAPHEARLELDLGTDLLATLSSLEWHDHWDFCLVLADESRRRSKCLLRVPITDLRPTLPVPTSNLSLSWMGRHGATLSIFIVQATDSAKVPGLPHREAQAVALKHFGINKAGPGADFPVCFASPELLIKEGFSADTTVVVTAEPEDFNAHSIDETSVRILINEKLRAAFASARRSRRQNVVQDNIRSQALAELLFLAKAAGELEKGSVGYNLVTRVFGQRGGTKVSLERVDDMQIFARAQSFSGLTESCKKVV